MERKLPDVKSRLSLLFFILLQTVVFSTFTCLHAKETPMYGIPEITHYTRQNYQAGTQNWKISQSDNGLMYFANNDGILEFDGSFWRLLPSSKVTMGRSVLAMGDKIYSAGHNEFGYFQFNGINDLEYTSLMDAERFGDIGDFWNILFFENQIVYQADKGIALFDYKKGKVTFIPAQSRITNAFIINDLFILQDEMAGLMEMRKGKLREIEGGEIFAKWNIGTLLSLSPDEILIGTVSNGVYVWDTKQFKPWEAPVSDFLNEMNIFCGIAYGDELVFGTIQSGVVITDKKGRIKSMVNKDRGLNNNTVLSLATDKDGNLWAGLDNGIAKIAYSSPINFIQHYYDLGTGYAVSFHQDNIYFGTNQGLYQITEKDFHNPLKIKEDFKRVPHMNGQVWSLFTDHTGQLLCGHNNGIYEISPTFRQISPLSIKGGWIFRYPPNREDLLLVGTYNGIVLLKKRENRWEYVKSLKGFDVSSRFMEWDEAGNLWVSHGYLGVFRLAFNETYDEIIQVEDFTDANGLPRNLALNLSATSEGLIFSSEKGIYGYDANSNSFYRSYINKYFVEDGEEFPTLVQEDDYHHLWYFTKDKVGVVRKLDDGSVQKIDAPFDPIKGKLVNGFENLYVIDERSVLIGIEDGFSHYAVDDSKTLQQPFNVHIRGFKNLTDSLDRAYYQSLGSNASFIPNWAYSQNSYTVRYAATNFESASIKYATYLENFDKDWSAYSTDNQRQFTNLHEGRYILHVKAVNSYGKESNTVSFEFYIDPPWYRSIPAKILYFILALVLIVFIWRIQKWYIKRSKLLALRKQEQIFKITEEKLKNDALEKEKEMIRLRNEKLRTEMVFKKKELANSTMNVIQKNEFLLNVKDELYSSKKLNESQLKQKINTIIRKIDKDIDNDSQWKIFETHLEQVHADFLTRLLEKHPDLTGREQKLCAYLRTDMSSKEISSLMNISVRSVENNRYKLREKLKLDRKENLKDFIMNI